MDSTVTLTVEKRQFYDNVVALTQRLRDDQVSIADLTIYSLLRAVCSSPAAAAQMLFKLANSVATGERHEALYRLGEAALSLYPSAKLDELRRILRRHEDAKVIVFTEFREAAALIAKRTGGVYPDGRLNGMELRERIDRFINTSDEHVLIATPRLAEGLNLQAYRVVVNFDLPWNPFKLEQRVGRVQRVGQVASEVLVYVLCGDRTFEAVVRDLLLKKLKLFETAIGHLSIPWEELAQGRTVEARIKDSDIQSHDADRP